MMDPYLLLYLSLFIYLFIHYYLLYLKLLDQSDFTNH